MYSSAICRCPSRPGTWIIGVATELHAMDISCWMFGETLAEALMRSEYRLGKPARIRPRIALRFGAADRPHRGGWACLVFAGLQARFCVSVHRRKGWCMRQAQQRRRGLPGFDGTLPPGGCQRLRVMKFGIFWPRRRALAPAARRLRTRFASAAGAGARQGFEKRARLSAGSR